MLTIRNLTIARLRPLSLTLDSGQSISINGPSGSGKTLLLRAIADLDPHDGEILLHGRNQQDIPPWIWRQKVAFLPAESSWWHDRVGDHFLTSDKSLAEKLKKLDLSPTILENNITHLSSGERQRLALLRLLQTPHEILLLDEPTANIDQQNTSRVEDFLLAYQRQTDCALVLVSHDTAQCARMTERHYQINGKEWQQQNTLI